MSAKYLLAHDLGTSGNKATLFSSEGTLLRSVTSEYGTKYFNNNWAEQDPAAWWRAVCSSTRELMQGTDPASIAVISLSGQMMGCVCVDRSGKELRNALIYADQRGVKEAAALESAIGAERFYRITGHRASASYSIEKFMWIREHEPEVYANTHKMLHAKDYINYLLTGRMVSEFSDASGTNAFDINSFSWSTEIMDASGIDGEKLPEVVASTEVIGELTGQAAEAMGLRAGIPVVAGGGDGVCAGVGAGSVKPGKTYNYLGSSSWIATTTREPIFDDQMRTFVWAHAVPGYVHPCGTMQTAGSSYAWLRNEVCTLEKEQAERAGESAYELINRQIETSPPGARGLIFLPYLMGERTPRWNPDAKGAFLGLTLEHRRADLLRSVLEGVSMNLSIILDIFRRRLDIREITVIGGGARGEVWRRIMADIYGAEVVMPDYLEEATSIGAAIIGGVGVGIFPGFDVVDRFLHERSRVRPDTSNAPVYERAKAVFERCYGALEPLFPELGSGPV
ncbi:xylulokinase [Salinispira pacifica]